MAIASRGGMPHDSKLPNDPTDTFSKQGKIVMITHIPSGKRVAFKAFVDHFSDRYNMRWNSEDVYGRMDPIKTFQRTSRSLDLSIAVPAASAYDSYKNLQRLSQHIRMCYPTYTNASKTGNRVLKAAPLLRVKFMNWARDAVNPNRGLVIALEGIAFAPDMKAGVFDGDDGTIMDVPLTDSLLGGLMSNFGDTTAFGTPSLYPKLFTLKLNGDILHTHPLGFSDEWGELPQGGGHVDTGGNPAWYNDGPGDAFPYAVDKAPRPRPSDSRKDLGPGNIPAASETQGILSDAADVGLAAWDYMTSPDDGSNF